MTVPRTTPISEMGIHRETDGSTDTEQNYLDYAEVGNNKNDNFIQSDADSDFNNSDVGSVDDRGRGMDLNKQFRIDDNSDSVSFLTMSSVKPNSNENRLKKDDDKLVIESVKTEDTGSTSAPQVIHVEQNKMNQTVPKFPPSLQDKASRRDEEIEKVAVNETVDKKDTTPVKLPNVQKCNHLISQKDFGKDTKFGKISKIQKDIVDSDKCVICEITEATAQYASVEPNRMLMEIVYPHEFYDKFQRSKKSRVRISDTKLTTKDTLPITRPAKFSPKLGRKDRGSTNSLAAGQEASDQQNTFRFSYRRSDTDRSELDGISPKKIPKKDNGVVKKEIHVHCRAKNNAVVITDDSEGQKLVLKGMKGWLMKKDDGTCKNKEHKEMKKCKYTTHFDICVTI